MKSSSVICANVACTHHAGVVLDNHVHAAEGLIVDVEQGTDGTRVADIGLAPDGLSAGGLDFANDGSGQIPVDDAIDVTLKPSRARRFAIAAPIPREEPVTIATLPFG